MPVEPIHASALPAPRFRYSPCVKAGPWRQVSGLVALADLMIARIFTTRMDAFAEINAAWEEVFTDGTTPPARTSVGVSALPLGAAVEIEFCFYRESGR